VRDARPRTSNFGAVLSFTASGGLMGPGIGAFR
jgi:hypothetical protein